MLKINFEIDGKPVTTSNIADALDKMILASIEEKIRLKLDGIRDPESGEFPIVSVRGRNLDNLSIQVSGSPKLIDLVKEMLGGEVAVEEAKVMGAYSNNKNPCAFICHSSLDKDLAGRIARDFIGQGIDAFYDTWSIGPGDSLRQKIDEGLEDCTHFVALLTPNSIDKPWVNAEMDAAFVRKVEGQCKFIPLRKDLSVEAIAPLLRALHSPEIKNYEEDVRSLVNFIHGITRKPPLGLIPSAIRESSNGATGLSPAAEFIAKLMIEASEHGDSFDPQMDANELKTAAALPEDDLVDAVDELVGRGFIKKHVTFGSGSLGFSFVTSEAALFSELDKFFMSWNPEEDALRVAADLVNGSDGGSVQDIAEKLGWLPRRVNPAVNYLIERELIDSSKATGTHPWCTHWIGKTHKTRRFVRDRG